MKCWFCRVNESEPDKAYEIEMYGDVTQAPGDTEEAVSFNKKLVVVPRCKSCKTRQKTARGAMGLMLLFLVLAAVAVGVGLLHWVRDLYWGIAAGFFVGMVIEFITVRYYATKGILSESKARHRHEEVLEYRTRGYEFGRAPKQQKVAEALYEED